MANETDRARAAEEPFQRAVEAHEQGRLEQAEQLYRAVLGGEPEHLGALHNLTILCFQRGEYSTAATLTYQVGIIRLT
jgi:Tfp pilus assembly protein PilF